MRRLTASQVQAAAADWFARTLSGDATTAELHQLEAWLEADPRHRGAFIRTQAMWHFLDAPAQAAAGQDLASEIPDEPPVSQGWRPSRRVLLGGALAIAASVAAIQIIPDVLFAEHQSLATRRGETSANTLSDGSQIVLDAESHAEISLKRSQRHVELVSGEGWFRVAKDKSRPFVVEANGITVTAVGTAFSVDKSDRIRVVVSEGVVQIASSGGEPVQVHRNQTAVISDGTVQITTLNDEEVRRRLAWREGYIGFNGETLAEAVASFNRFNNEQLVVADEKLGDRRVVGWFSRNDPWGFAKASATMLGGRVDRVNDRIILSRE